MEIAPNAWSGPVSNATSAITFRQQIDANDALRTGTYSNADVHALDDVTVSAAEGLSGGQALRSAAAVRRTTQSGRWSMSSSVNRSTR